jgi:hypothetical protein
MSAICGGHRSPLAPSGKNDHVRSAKEWHLSPKQSLLLQAGHTVINSPLAANNKIEPVFGTSLHDLKEVSMPPIGDLMMRNDGSRGSERDVYPAISLDAPVSFSVASAVGSDRRD